MVELFRNGFSIHREYDQTDGFVMKRGTDTVMYDRRDRILSSRKGWVEVEEGDDPRALIRKIL